MRRHLHRHWAAIQLAEDVYHVIPRFDAIAHEISDDCVCGPTSECIVRSGHSDLWMHTHHPLELREGHR